MRSSPIHKALIKSGVGSNRDLDNTIDLATPDPAAADLADKLRTAQMNFMFSKAVVFVGKWIIRPFVWWPIKYTFLSIFKLILVGARDQPKRNWIDDLNQEARRQRDLEDLRTRT